MLAVKFIDLRYGSMCLVILGLLVSPLIGRSFLVRSLIGSSDVCLLKGHLWYHRENIENIIRSTKKEVNLVRVDCYEGTV